METFYERIANLCKTKNIDITNLVKQLNLSTSMPTNWKNGTLPSANTLILLSAYFDVSIDYLIKGKEKMSNNSISGDGNIAIQGSPYSNIDTSQKNFTSNKKDNDISANNLLCLFEQLSDREKQIVFETIKKKLEERNDANISFCVNLYQQEIDRKYYLINHYDDLLLNDKFVIFMEFMKNTAPKDIAYILEDTWKYLEQQKNTDGSKKYNIPDILKNNKIIKSLFKLD